jgi:hypothetical protein
MNCEYCGSTESLITMAKTTACADCWAVIFNVPTEPEGGEDEESPHNTNELL